MGMGALLQLPHPLPAHGKTYTTKNVQKCPFSTVPGHGTYRIFLAAQFYTDPLSFIEFGDFSCELGKIL